MYSCVFKCVPILYSVFFCIYPKTSLSIFTPQKSSQISKEYIYTPLSNMGWIKNKFWHISKYSFKKIPQFRNFPTKSHNFRICYNILLLINHGLWNWPSSQTRKKTESDLTTLQNLLYNPQSLHMDMPI